jgi:integrase/recombinase XerD
MSNFAKYKTEYLNWMEQTHHSSQTIEVRGRLLEYFFRWCDERGLINIEEISRSIVESYQRYLFKYRKANGEALVISSQTKRLTAVRAFYKYLSSKHYVVYNPAADIHLPKATFRLPRQIFSPEEVEQVMIQPDLNTPEGLRDRAILELFYSTGMRRMELANLTIYDVEASRQIVFIKEGKGRKDRVVPIGERALGWLIKYQENTREKLILNRDEPALFVGIHGEPICNAYITELCGRYIKKADLGKKGSCHIFRHTMATLMLENGADIRFIQEILGHSSLRTTQLYTQVSIKQLQSVHKLTHPASLSKTE